MVMVEAVEVSSFDESGYHGGPFGIIFSSSLAREADEQDEWLASMGNGSKISTTRILLTLLQGAVLAKATYIHIHPRRFEFVVRYRVGNRLWEASASPLNVYWPFCGRLKMLFNINIAERRVPQFGRSIYEQSGSLYELRLSSIPVQFGEAFVINVLPQMGQGDYAVDRHEWQDKMTVEDVMAQIQAARQEEAQ